MFSLTEETELKIVLPSDTVLKDLQPSRTTNMIGFTFTGVPVGLDHAAATPTSLLSSAPFPAVCKELG
jgi:hypothetical protein